MINKRTEIGENIRKTRLEKGLTQENLAERMCLIQNNGKGGNPQTVSRIENAVNDFGIDTLLVVAEALEVSPQSLLPVTDSTCEQTESAFAILLQTEQDNGEQLQIILSVLKQLLEIVDRQ
ncbi:MAG: helix-turn-helix transcriptional regulator [Lachnospira sp.]|nr:helix-turn-helix transcriptional regulator [Lachnospira sp.]